MSFIKTIAFAKNHVALLQPNLTPMVAALPRVCSLHLIALLFQYNLCAVF